MDPGIELHTARLPVGRLSSERQTDEDETPQVERLFSLPRADDGRDAWLFLASSFFVEALVWGFPFAFGVFQEYYAHHDSFRLDVSHIPIIGTTSIGLMYSLGLFITPVYSRYPWARRHSSLLGLFIIISALLLASFANNVWQLILTQGVLYGFGGAFLYYPVLSYLDEWFIRRKGIAFGILWAGTGAAGMTLPPMISALLDHYSYRTVLRAWACVSFVILSPLMYFVKPRLPQATSRQARRFDLRFLMSPVLWTVQLCNILESLGYFIPNVYLPTVAHRFGSSYIEASGALVALNLAAVFGGLIVGFLVDRMPVMTVMLMTSAIAAAATFLVWGFAESFPLLVVYAVLYGLSAGGYSTTWPGIIRELHERYSGADTAIIFAILGIGRGTGAILSGPLSTALIGSTSALQHAASGYGSEYGRLIIFTGVTAAAGGLGWFARSLRLI